MVLRGDGLPNHIQPAMRMLYPATSLSLLCRVAPYSPPALRQLSSRLASSRQMPWLSMAHQPPTLLHQGQTPHKSS